MLHFFTFSVENKNQFGSTINILCHILSPYQNLQLVISVFVEKLCKFWLACSTVPVAAYGVMMHPGSMGDGAKSDMEPRPLRAA